MNFSIERHGDTMVVGVPGHLIVQNRQELKQLVLDELENGAKNFLIDFSRTGYIDSAGLGALVSLRKRVREQGGELRLANLSDDLKQLLRLTKVDTLLPRDDRGDDDDGGGPTASLPLRPNGSLFGAEPQPPHDRPSA